MDIESVIKNAVEELRAEGLRDDEILILFRRALMNAMDFNGGNDGF